ncbi:MAG: hypothetical protein HUJ70_03985 [Pseudobutyrivibrio sp.]|nr:hypothetical protein [Pseudobutyrivibrio sp.]
MIYVFVIVPAILILTTTIITYNLVGFRMGVLLRNILICGLVCGILSTAGTYTVAYNRPDLIVVTQSEEAKNKPSALESYVNTISQRAERSRQERSVKNNKKWSGDFWATIVK